MLEWFGHRRPASEEEAASDPGQPAIVGVNDTTPPNVAPALWADPTAQQYEVYNGSITTGADAVFEASREPERWTIYLVTATNTDQARATLGQADATPAVYMQYRHVIVLPGRGTRLVVHGISLAGPTTVVAIASSNLPVEVAPA